MGKLQKLQKSKILISLLVAVLLVFSFNHSKPKAFIPLAWGAAVLGGMVAETVVTMGVKAISKQVLKKKSDDFAAKALAEGKYDFMGTNPYRNKDGSITVSPSANDRAKLAGLISGSLLGSMIGDGLTSPDTYCMPPGSQRIRAQMLPPIQTPDTYNVLTTATAYTNLALSLTVNYTDPVNPEFDLRWIADNSKIVLSKINPYSVGQSDVYMYVHSYYFTTEKYLDGSANAHVTIVQKQNDGTYKELYKVHNILSPVANQKIFQSKDGVEQLGADLIMCDGLVFPSTVENIYPVPMNITNNYIMPNNSKLINNTITINNVMPPSSTEGEITWQELDNYYKDNNLNINDVMAGNIDNYLEKGVINNNPWTIEEINNIYTDLDYDEKAKDFKPPTGEIVPLPPGELTPVEPINRGMLQVMKESYQFLADGIENSIQSMKTVTDKSMGLINYLDTAFRWLPAEWRAMFGAAFVLGVFAHFFRR